MLRIAGQTAGPIGLNFFVDIHGSKGCADLLREILSFNDISVKNHLGWFIQKNWKTELLSLTHSSHSILF